MSDFPYPRDSYGRVQPVHRTHLPDVATLQGGRQSIGSRVLERILPEREAHRAPVEVNPFQKALDDYDRVSKRLMVVEDELRDKENKLVLAYQETEALQARYDNDMAEYRRRDTVSVAEVNALGRSMVELATQVEAIGNILGTGVNLTITAKEIVRRFKDRFREELEFEQANDPPPQNTLEPVHEYQDRMDGRLPVNKLRPD